MIICDNNNIDIIQGVIGYGNAEGITDWRIQNTSTGVFNILNSTSATARLSIIDNGNIGIRTTPSISSSKFNINGFVSCSGIYKKNNINILNDTSNYVLSTSNILVSRILTYSVNQWKTTSNNITYYNSSNVGIGAINPTSKLYLYDDSVNETKLTIQNNSNIIPSGGVYTSIELIRGTENDSNRDYKIGNYGGDFIIKSSLSSKDTDYIKITGSTGAITNPTGTASWTSASDKRIKENIERASYDKCYESINKLELNRFNYIKGFNTVNRDITQLGFIAQEVKEIFPKAIFIQEFHSDTLNIPDLHSIDITQINYTLYGAVKKLIEKVNNNVKKIEKIENILNIDSDITLTSNITYNLIMN